GVLSVARIFVALGARLAAKRRGCRTGLHELNDGALLPRALARNGNDQRLAFGDPAVLILRDAHVPVRIERQEPLLILQPDIQKRPAPRAIDAPYTADIKLAPPRTTPLVAPPRNVDPLRAPIVRIEEHAPRFADRGIRQHI